MPLHKIAPIYVYTILNDDGTQEPVGPLTEFTEEMVSDEHYPDSVFYEPQNNTESPYTIKFYARGSWNRLLWKLGLKPEYEYKPNNWRKLHGIPMKRKEPKNKDLQLYEITAKADWFIYQEEKAKIFLINKATRYTITYETYPDGIRTIHKKEGGYE